MAQIEVVMPKMGESIMEGTIIEWYKQPGEEIEQDETLLEIATDKVDSEIPAPEAGYLKEILVEEGETVGVGTPIAILVDSAEELEGAEAPSGDQEDQEVREERVQEEETAPQPAVPTEAADQAEGPGDEGQQVEVTMPKMGESIVEGTIIQWYKQPGDRVEEDETLLEIATDKVDSEIPSPIAGVVTQILVEEGETVEVGKPLALIGTGAAAQAGEAPAPGDGKEVEEVHEAPATAAPQPAAEPSPGPSGDGAPTVEPERIPRHGSEGRFFSPLVRSIAEKEGLTLRDLESVEGSGAGGRVTKDDVLRYLDEQQAEPGRARLRGQETRRPAQAEPAEISAEDYDDRVEIVEMDRMRQVIAEHMVHSKRTSAHVTSFTEADVTNLVRLREKRKDEFFEREGVRLSYTPFFVQAAVEALREHPRVNASVEGKHIIIRKEYHVGIAVAVGDAGLLVPVVRNAGQKNLVGLTTDIADLARRARNKKLQPDELQGGTFTVTNIGSLGSVMGTPIINQPQVAILGPGVIKKRPVVIEHPVHGDTIGIRHMMYLSLSYDHRIIDGAMAASFLQAVVSNLESIDPDETI